MSLGTLTGVLFAIAGVALLTVFIVITVRQHNDIASSGPPVTTRMSPETMDGPEKRLIQPVLEIKAGTGGRIIGKTGPSRAASSSHRRAITQAKDKPAPIETTAQCNGPNAPNCTRWDMWSKCFIPLADLHPKDGFLTKSEVAAFMEKHLRFYERWAAPSADTISADCDKKKGGNGRVNWAIFRDSTSPGCLGTTRDICLAKGACDRELEKLGMPPVVALPSAPKASAASPAPKAKARRV